RQGALTGSVFSKVPVLLIEMGVLTNPRDEAILASAKGQAKIADAITAATLAVIRTPNSPKSE
ncbi:MAG: N-acetylmuramoyl-L-alanine amidase, partial [Cytophagales bacterium]|nr:N-acetylmuramoyl-L-alanine amidase [Armatimonadota bacterium]